MSGGDGYVDFEWGVYGDIHIPPRTRGFTRFPVWPLSVASAMRRAVRKAKKLDREYLAREAYGDSFCRFIRETKHHWIDEGRLNA